VSTCPPSLPLGIGPLGLGCRGKGLVAGVAAVSPLLTAVNAIGAESKVPACGAVRVVVDRACRFIGDRRRNRAREGVAGERWLTQIGIGP
jgi:hypothetical protein